MVPPPHAGRNLSVWGPSEIPSFVPAEDRPRQREYSSGEAAQQVGVTATTLRNWEERFGDLVPVRRDERGHRRFSEEAVQRLRKVQRLRAEHGLSLDEVACVLRLRGARERQVAVDLVERYGRDMVPLVAKLVAEVGDLPRAAAFLDEAGRRAPRDEGANGRRRSAIASHRWHGPKPTLARMGTRLHGEKRDREILNRIRQLQAERCGKDRSWLARLRQRLVGVQRAPVLKDGQRRNAPGPSPR